AQLVQTVRVAGYNCGKATVTIAIADLHYAPSVAPLEQELARVPGVIKVAANQATESVTVEYVPGVTTAEALERAVEAVGFRVAAAILPGSVERLQAPQRRHEHAHRRRDGRGVPVLPRRHILPRAVRARRPPRRRLLRGGRGDHRPDPPRAPARGARQGPHVRSDPPARRA